MKREDYIYIKDRRIELTKAMKNRMNANQININVVQDRLSHGWTLEEAIGLNARHVQKEGEIYWVYQGIFETLYIPEKVRKNIHIQKYQLRKNLENGKSLKEILQNDFEYFVERNDRSEADLELEDRKRKEAAKELAEERLRKEKAHLYNGTPQFVKPTSNMKNLEYTALSMFMTESEKKAARIKINMMRMKEGAAK
ncbi:hypothetical protein K2V61_01580 [Staphylococcus simulans]|uniref:hypothetical protein n=1 Tax=Staphylococcus simulans TaxID=1286 RepID=UPI001E646814|nr:hypothetical protein [Staphylococcus simulans]MCD8914250.1 hypothetical protein [Staphylococcus simulans]